MATFRSAFDDSVEVDYCTGPIRIIYIFARARKLAVSAEMVHVLETCKLDNINFSHTDDVT